MPAKTDSDAIARDIKRRTRKKYNAEEKISIVLEGLRDEESITAICRREGLIPTPVLPLEKRVPGGRQEAASGGYLS